MLWGKDANEKREMLIGECVHETGMLTFSQIDFWKFDLFSFFSLYLPTKTLRTIKKRVL